MKAILTFQKIGNAGTKPAGFEGIAIINWSD